MNGVTPVTAPEIALGAPTVSRAAGRVLAPTRAVLANRELVRLSAAYGAFVAAEFGVWVAMLVYAYGRGGATEAGIVALVQLAPAIVVAPLASTLADTLPPGRVLAGTYAIQALAMGATAAVLVANGSAVLAYALATVAATAVTVTRPAQAALLPAVVRRPAELSAANVATGWVESAAVLAAPALAGVLLAVASPGVAFAVFAAPVALGGLAVYGLGPRQTTPGGAAGEPARVAAGVLEVLRDPALRVLVTTVAATFVVVGALDVLTVSLSAEDLGLGAGGAGYLAAAIGGGGLVGASLAGFLFGRPRLSRVLLLATVTLGLPVVVLGLAPSVGAAFTLLAVAGVGNQLVRITSRTLLQRTATPSRLARVFGVLEGVEMAALAVGSVGVVPLVAAFGTPATIVVVGVFAPVLVLGLWRQLRSVDERATMPVVEFALLRSLPVFAPLMPPEIEGVARSLITLDVPAGTVVIREGDAGDRFYLIASGEVDVSKSGAQVATLSRGDGFGEIALLRNVPRQATCVARTACLLYAIEREEFVAAVTGHALSAAAADELIRQRQK